MGVGKHFSKTVKNKKKTRIYVTLVTESWKEKVNLMMYT